MMCLSEFIYHLLLCKCLTCQYFKLLFQNSHVQYPVSCTTNNMKLHVSYTQPLSSGLASWYESCFTLSAGVWLRAIKLKQDNKLREAAEYQNKQRT